MAEDDVPDEDRGDRGAGSLSELHADGRTRVGHVSPFVGPNGLGSIGDLYVRPKIQRFSASEQDKFVAYLQDENRNSGIRPLAGPRDLQMSYDYETLQDGYRFTHAAFQQAAQIAAPGIGSFLPDLAGTKLSARNEGGRTSAMMAVRLWNSLIALRFSLFSRYTMIYNYREKRIDGFMGANHKYLDNLGMYSEAVNSLATHRPQAEFYAARVISRKMALWFRDRDPLFEFQLDRQNCQARAGCYYTNGEATGTSVRGTLALFLPHGICLGPYRRYGKRVSHAGKDFFRRVGELFAAVWQGEVPQDRLRVGMESACVTSLRLQHLDEVDRAARKRKLVHSLSLLGVPRDIAKEVIDSALTAGRRLGTGSPARLDPAVQVDRTVVDIIVPLLYYARKVDPVRRERMEQAAFDMLLGRFLL